MYETIVGWILIVMALVLMCWVGIQAIAGRNAAYYRIVAICLALGVNLNTTENVTGSAMSEFGVWMLLVGLFFGLVLAALDAYGFISIRRRKAVLKHKAMGHGLKQS